jgi:hypothetical protein
MNGGVEMTQEEKNDALEVKRINIRMPLHINEWVNEQAQAHGVSVTAFINMRLAEIKRQDDMMKAMTVMTNEKVIKMLEGQIED